MPVYRWSQAAANNATADITAPFPEGMAPSAVNDGIRGAMAAVAMYRDDIAGAIVTAGTSTAYTVASYSQFNSLASLNGQVIAFTPHTTNGAGPVTLNVDGLGAKPLRSAPNTEFLAGVLVQGTPYVAIYNNTDGAFYIHGFFGNPYNVPLAAGFDYWAPTAPNSSFAFPYGQAISRTTYASLFALIGTTYGTGDGSTTFNLPDKRGRVSVAADNMGGSQANRINGVLGNALGSVGGAPTQTLVTANLPPYTPSGSVSASASTNAEYHTSIAGVNVGGAFNAPYNMTTGSVSVSASFAGNAQGGTSTPFNTVQPSIVCNHIMRIL